MKRSASKTLTLTLTAGLVGGLLLASGGAESASGAGVWARESTAKPHHASTVTPDGRPAPKPVSKNVTSGLAYLVNQQHRDGGWGQGGGWRQSRGGGRAEGNIQQERSDVGNTAVAALALLRAGHTPHSGQYAANVRRGIDFICKKVHAADDESLYITDVRDTQIQMKIGAYVDTFLASSVLAEVKGEMPDADSEQTLGRCLNKVLAKIERNQRDDGGFADNRGWASVLSEGLANRSLNRAAQKGAAVSDRALARAQRAATRKFDGAGGYASSGDDAGVGIYGASTGMAGLADSIATGEQQEDDARQVLADPAARPADKREAKAKLDRLEEARDLQRQAKKRVVAQLSDSRFVSGFGSNGGEEFLSYMNISESLLAEGGPEWQQWDSKMTANLNRVQNGDGSWSGQHCITGRTFVTSTALLVLLADRAPVATSSHVRGS